ncbi:MAG: DUF2752 domain-containing protein [bacterium]
MKQIIRPRNLGFGAATFVLTFYLGWNVWWLSRGYLPPSILKYFTGVPVSTTGLTRSVRSAWHGNFITSFYWNPFTVPILFLFVFSIVYTLIRFYRRKEMVFPSYLAWSWGIVLVLAWVVKLLQGPTWW